MDSLTVLVTGIGAPGVMGTLYSLRHNPEGRKIKIVGVDIDELAVGKKHVEKFYTIPLPDKEEFVEGLLDIAKKEKVDVILPQVTNELVPLAKNKTLFEENGVAVAVSSLKAIEIANDKAKLLEMLKKLNLPAPKFRVVEHAKELKQAIFELGYPEKYVVVKPSISRGLRGFRVITSKSQGAEVYYERKPGEPRVSLDDFLSIFKGIDVLPKPLVVMEYLPGKEYSVDAFRDGKRFIAIPRIREKIKCGISFVTKVEKHREIIDISRLLANDIGLE